MALQATVATNSGYAHYEDQSVSLLSRTPAVAKDPKQENNEWPESYNYLQRRMSALRSWRYSWWAHWAALAENMLPRRYHWLVTPNSMNRGSPINQSILDPTPCQAIRVCTAGMLNGLMSAERTWFKFKPAIENFPLDREAKIWFEEVEKRLYAVMAGSNFYQSMWQMFEDLIVFGTAPVIIYEDRKDIIRCYNPCAGEYYLGAGGDFRVNSLFRNFNLTVTQAVQMFGLDNCGPDIQQLWRNKADSLETEILIGHAIEPNIPMGSDSGSRLGVVPGGFAYREVYWEWGKTTPRPLSVRGFNEEPFIAPRWATTSNDAYGRSPGMDALPDVLQLKVMTARLAEAIEKQVRPPMQADMSMKNEPSSTLPGAITYVADVAKGGMRPVYEVNPQTADMKAMIDGIQRRVYKWFFNDLFQMMAQLEGVQPRNEMEIAERRGEKLQVLGPIVENIQQECANKIIHRVLRIMNRRKLIPPKPQSLNGVDIEIEYISMLALSQKASRTAGMERTLTMVGRMAAINPSILDNIDQDEWVREYADLLDCPPKPIRTVDQMMKLRAQNAQNAQAAAQAQSGAQLATHTAPALAQSAQLLSNTDVGGGVNALQLMTGQASPSGEFS